MPGRPAITRPATSSCSTCGACIRAEETDDAGGAGGDRRQGIEGYQASKWVVQDYGDMLVHVFDPDTRAYYSLEELWADAPRVDWERE